MIVASFVVVYLLMLCVVVLVHRRRMNLAEARAVGIITAEVPDEPHLAERRAILRVGWTRPGLPRNAVWIGSTAMVLERVDPWSGEVAPIVFPKDRVRSLRIVRRGFSTWLHPVAPDGRLIDVAIGFGGFSVIPAQDFVSRGGWSGVLEH